MSALAWFLTAHFAATDPAVIGIAASDLHEDWVRVSVLSVERIEREIGDVEPFDLAGAKFDLRADLDRDGRDEQIVAGVYETHGGETGSFLLVATGSDAKGWRRAYLCGAPERENFSAVEVYERDVHWFGCLNCDSSVVLRRRWWRYTLGDSHAAIYEGNCK